MLSSAEFQFIQQYVRSHFAISVASQIKFPDWSMYVFRCYTTVRPSLKTFWLVKFRILYNIVV